MTKIAIKGPATGTGTYTLRAPVTADTLDLELPSVGTHLASAQADGMPLGPGGDPVVESGSNTDGEWTRWADGTQHCIKDHISYSDIGSSTPNAGGAYGQSVLYPLPFVSVGAINYTSTTDIDTSAPERNRVGVRKSTVNGFEARIAIVESNTAPRIQYFATGRWK